jgi:adenylylsulfate reductase subunit B
MSIEISAKKCCGCGACVKVCPGSLLRIVDKTAVIRKPENCWGCASCVKACYTGVIELYISADAGG